MTAARFVSGPVFDVRLTLASACLLRRAALALAADSVFDPSVASPAEIEELAALASMLDDLVPGDLNDFTA